MQIKTVFIQHFSPNKPSKIQKFENIFHQQSFGEMITLIHCCGNAKRHNSNGGESGNSY